MRHKTPLEYSPRDFLQTLWKHQLPHTPGGHVFLPTIQRTPGSKQGHYQEHPPLVYPQDWENIIQQARTNCTTPNIDAYFTPNLFNIPTRKTTGVTNYDTPRNILYVDGDLATPLIGHVLEPTYAWWTSDNKWSAVWLLEDTFPNIKAMETANKALAHHVGADPSGWDYSQLLRLPRSVNHKYDPPQEARGFQPTLRKIYRTTDFTRLPPPPEPPTVVEGVFEPTTQGDAPFPLTDVQILELLNEIEEAGGFLTEDGLLDRSRSLYAAYRMVYRRGVTDPFDIASIMQHVGPLQKHDFNWMVQDAARFVVREKALMFGEKRGVGGSAAEVRPTNFNTPDLEELTVADCIQEFKNQLAGASHQAVPGGLRLRVKNLLQPQDYPPQEWDVENLVTRGDPKIGMIVGDPKSGKTMLTLTLAVALATGGDFLGRATRRQNVLLFEREDSERMTATRIQSLLSNSVGDGVVPVDAGELNVDTVTSVDLTSLESIGEVLYLIKTTQSGVVVFDTLATVKGDAELNSSDGMVRVMQNAKLIGQLTGAHIIFVHHTRKGGESVADMAGSQQINAGWNFAIFLGRDAQTGGTSVSFAGKEITSSCEQWKLKSRGEGVLMWERVDDVGGGEDSDHQIGVRVNQIIDWWEQGLLSSGDRDVLQSEVAGLFGVSVPSAAFLLRKANVRLGLRGVSLFSQGSSTGVAVEGGFDASGGGVGVGGFGAFQADLGGNMVPSGADGSVSEVEDSGGDGDGLFDLPTVEEVSDLFVVDTTVSPPAGFGVDDIGWLEEEGSVPFSTTGDPHVPAPVSVLFPDDTS